MGNEKLVEKYLDGWCDNCLSQKECLRSNRCLCLINPKAKVFIEFVKNLAALSKCKEGKVAAILVDTDFSQVYSIGINGGPAGQDDCLCGAKYGCVHAEQNCLAKNSNFTSDKIMICTKQCCQTCASLIINSNARIREFWYIDSYKDNKGLQILKNARIKCVCVYAPLQNITVAPITTL